MKAHRSGLLAVFSLRTLLALPSPALAGPKNDEADDPGEIPISIDLVARKPGGDGLWVTVTFTCPVSDSYDLHAFLVRTSMGRISGATSPCPEDAQRARRAPEGSQSLRRPVFRGRDPILVTVVMTLDNTNFEGFERLRIRD